MKKDKVIESLEKQKATVEGCLIFVGRASSYYRNSFEDDIIALDYAIKKVKKDKSYMSSYYEGAWHMFLLIFLVKVIDVLFNMFWA